MSRPLVVRMVLAFVLCSLVLSSPALAEPRQAAAAGPETWYGWFLDALTALWGENGCRLDPFGGCGEAASDLDAGCRADPNGGCAIAASDRENGCSFDPYGGCAKNNKDVGCMVDPYGGCAAAANELDNGCRLDPNGGCLQ